MEFIYCVYLTIYLGNKLPPFYIGYSSIEKVERGYHGSVSSEEYKEIYERELKDNPHLFKTTIITKHFHKKEASDKEQYFQKIFKVKTNPMYINKSIGGHCDLTGRINITDGIIERKILKHEPIPEGW